jgi:uncharacterized protein
MNSLSADALKRRQFPESAKAMAKHTPPPGWKNPLAPQQPLASTRWILGGFVATLGLAAVCVYITFCLLFWQGQWQLVFQPERTITRTPASDGLKYDNISFDATETGVFQLNAWWIPAESNAPFAADTLLLMHDGRGSLSDALPQVAALHRVGINVFVFDYRGFGQSANVHPSEARTYQDSDAAWTYLTDTRHLRPSTIALDGVGVGAVIAAETARRHREAPALILEDPLPPVLDSLQFDSRTHLLPIRLLIHDRFELLKKLRSLATPRLVIYTAKTAPYDVPGARATISDYADEKYAAELRTFLSKYLSGR